MLSSLLLLLLLGWASIWALATHGWWISPAGMLVGVLIEAFVIGGVHNAEQLLLGGAAAAPPAPGAAAPTTLPTPARPASEDAAQPNPATRTADDGTAYWQGACGWVHRGLAWLPSMVWLVVLWLALGPLMHCPAPI